MVAATVLDPTAATREVAAAPARLAPAPTRFGGARPLGVEARRAHGRALRGSVRRGSHAGWRRVPTRDDPIRLLQVQSRSWLPALVPVRFGRMLASPFAYFQGTASVMAADLATTPTTGIEVQLCGNAHPSNFGVFASPDRPLLFDVDEFDDTIPGPWEWDVKRLAAGLVIVGRQVGSGTDRRREMVLSALGSYRRRMRALASLREIDVWYWHMPAAAIRTFLTAAGRKGRAGCTGRPDIVGAGAEAEVESTFWEQASLVMRPNLAHDFPFVRDVIEEYQQTVAQQQQRFLRQATVADVALQRDGIANLGIRRFLVSLRSPEDECLVLQVSEAQASHVTRHVARNVYRNQGQRIVAGQRMIQAAEDPFLGWVRASDGNAYWIRRVPERRVAADVSTMSVRALRRYAELCGAAVACAHARSGDRIQIAAYLGKSDRFDRAIVRFAESYAEQVERDYEGLIRAARSGRIPAESYSTSPADA